MKGWSDDRFITVAAGTDNEFVIVSLLCSLLAAFNTAASSLLLTQAADPPAQSFISAY